MLVEAAHALCAECWPKIRFITEPLCAACGMPFEFEASDGSVCAVCVSSDRPFARARAAIAYDDGSRGFILAFKHGDRTDAARVFAPWMAQAGRDLLGDVDLMVPVPLHWTRLFKRRYNQAALLAQGSAGSLVWGSLRTCWCGANGRHRSRMRERSNAPGPSLARSPSRLGVGMMWKADAFCSSTMSSRQGRQSVAAPER
jgi:predicted amidophosphoribosyltransferase